MEERKRHPRIEELKARIEADYEERQRRLNQPKTPAATRYTTQAAIDWGRRQSWRLVDRERFDVRTKRHHDVLLGCDALFHAPGIGLVAVQSAGRYERTTHLERFERMGGKLAARDMGVVFRYLEFQRGNPDPVLDEVWS